MIHHIEQLKLPAMPATRCRHDVRTMEYECPDCTIAALRYLGATDVALARQAAEDLNY